MRSVPQKKVDIINLKGGIDLASTLLNVNAGAALGLINFEPELEGGYRRINGYERLDGRAAPSDAIYYTVQVADATGIDVGDTLTGATSAATSVVVIKDGNSLGITSLVGSYTLGEVANGTTITEIQQIAGQSDIQTDLMWQYAAEQYYRSLITAVPGNGPALYGFHFEGDDYALRADGGVVKLYRGTASGWVVIPFHTVLFFDAGVMAEGEITEGTTITGATSAATGIVKRFVRNDGVYATDASGYMIVDTSGTFTDGENIQVETVTKCVADGASSPITLAPGGKYQHRVHNFYGTSAFQRVYVCDGVNPAWEFDGDVLTPIYFPDQSASWNKPTFIEVHRTFLFLQFVEGTMARSVAGEPLNFSGLMGADEFGLGDTCTGMISRAGNVLAIYTKNITYGLYGTSAADFELRVISDSFGAIPYTAQKVGTVYALDAKGIAPLERVDAYGDFESATVSRKIKPIIEQYKNRVIGSCVVKARNQYRIFFDDGSAIVMTDDQYIGENIPAFSRLQFLHVPTFVSHSDDEDGGQVILFGDADGFIYRMERGYNFDGEDIEFAYRQPFAHQGAPHTRKTYRRLFIDLDADRSLTLQVGYDLGFGRAGIPTSLDTQIQAEGGGGFWDVSNWDEFYWDVAISSSSGMALHGTAQNISVVIYGNSSITRPFTIQTLEIHYLPRRLRRE